MNNDQIASTVDRVENTAKAQFLAGVVLLAAIYTGRTIKQVIQKEGA
jgi:hypothetical protein